MNTQNFVGSTTAAGEDDNNNNNNLSLQRSNGSITIPSYEGNYHVDISSTNFELETITSSYTGLMRIYRLLYIAEHYSIRRGHDDLGDHYLDAGDFFNAVCCYVRSQYYCITPRHMMTIKAEQAIESLESTAKLTVTLSVTITMVNPMEALNSSTTNSTVVSD
ncbi:unnamed protein product [Rotaria sordida]|uniref:Uncharacterized protein n=1 Tax=Rotaria sordida TaxID=392033 RepID=A0A816DGP9_9BILA|nr:unnamed protein product [Rotaria sordida]CAF1489791.1 unnamed protein product [Rotaria sordida]CAF1638146.1 unnamed protein product [Rotaria sordida]